MARPRLAPKLKHGHSLRLRLRADHDKLIRKAAEHAGITISDWLRERAIEAARAELAA